MANDNSPNTGQAAQDSGSAPSGAEDADFSGSEVMVDDTIVGSDTPDVLAGNAPPYVILADVSDDETSDSGDDDHWLHFGTNVDVASVSELSIGILRDALKAAGEPQLSISASVRDANGQAQVMYDALTRDGADTWKKIYTTAGQSVIDVFSQGGDEATVVQAMATEITKVGASSVSRHCVDGTKTNVIDIMVDSLQDADALTKQLKADTRISRVIVNDDAIHIEIAQDGAADSSASGEAAADDASDAQGSGSGDGKTSTWGSLTVSWGTNADESAISSETSTVVSDILSGAGETAITVTTTSRDATNQARAMFTVLERDGADTWNKVYTAPGQAVITAYTDGKSNGSDADTIKKAMEDAINQQGPSKVSAHCVDPSETNVLDILIDTLKNANAVEQALQGDKRVARVLVEDQVIHIEVAQSGGDGSPAAAG